MNKRKVLIADESVLIANQLANQISTKTILTPVLVKNFQELQETLAGSKTDFLMAVSSLTLKGGKEGEAIDFCVHSQIPTVVLTSNMKGNIRNKMLNRNVLAYILKRPECMDQIIHLLDCLILDQRSSVLVVDDSATSRSIQVSILAKMNFTVYQAADGDIALDMIHRIPGISLVMTDYLMPKMNGLDLVSEIRKHHPMEKMALIGISALDDPMLSVQFLKRGASDFLHKPFLEEEFLCRVHNNLKIIEMIGRISSLSNLDYLTGLNNRKYFFETVEPIYEKSQKEDKAIWLAILDLDKFKSINDTYGHDAGDIALKATAQLLKKHFSSARCVARFGGEEFCIFDQGSDALFALEAFRMDIASLVIPWEDQEIRFTVSTGVTTSSEGGLDKMIRRADEFLYHAKKSGRNQVVADLN